MPPYQLEKRNFEFNFLLQRINCPGLEKIIPEPIEIQLRTNLKFKVALKVAMVKKYVNMRTCFVP